MTLRSEVKIPTIKIINMTIFLGDFKAPFSSMRNSNGGSINANPMAETAPTISRNTPKSSNKIANNTAETNIMTVKHT